MKEYVIKIETRVYVEANNAENAVEIARGMIQNALDNGSCTDYDYIDCTAENAENAE